MKLLMKRSMEVLVLISSLGGLGSPAIAERFFLVDGVDPERFPASQRSVFRGMIPGTFHDGDRLAGNAITGSPATWLGNGTPLFNTNQFGSLSFLMQRGSLSLMGSPIPFMGITFLGGPKLDLDGDLENATRSLIPVMGQTAVAIPNSLSSVDLTFNGTEVTLHGFDATGTNEGAPGLAPENGVTVNSLAGTATSFLGTHAPLDPMAINPSIDDRSGFLAPHNILNNVFRIDNLGGELWQDSTSIGSSGASALGTIQFLDQDIQGWWISRPSRSDPWPTLTGELGATLWPNAAVPGQIIQEAHGPGGSNGGSTTIADGASDDIFGPQGLATSDLGAYLDNVVVPHLLSGSTSFIYLESAGFGANNNADPVFGETVGYDTVIIAQNFRKTIASDLSSDGVVDILDFAIFAGLFGCSTSMPMQNQTNCAEADFAPVGTPDNVVDILDFGIFASAFGASGTGTELDLEPPLANLMTNVIGTTVPEPAAVGLLGIMIVLGIRSPNTK